MKTKNIKSMSVNEIKEKWTKAYEKVGLPPPVFGNKEGQVIYIPCTSNTYKKPEYKFNKENIRKAKPIPNEILEEVRNKNTLINILHNYIYSE